MKKILTTQSKNVYEQLMLNLVAEYKTLTTLSINSAGAITWSPLQKFRDFLSLPNNKKGERIMRYRSGNNNGNMHFWYLKIFYKAQEKAADQLTSASTWSVVNKNNYRNFEEWYDYIKGVLANIDHISYVVWYDVALIQAYLLRQAIMPNEYVYFHALPLWAAVQVFEKLGVAKADITRMKKDHRLAKTKIPICFQSLTAYEIEDFFCWLAHNMHRVYNYKHPKNNSKRKIKTPKPTIFSILSPFVI